MIAFTVPRRGCRTLGHIAMSAVMMLSDEKNVC